MAAKKVGFGPDCGPAARVIAELLSEIRIQKNRACKLCSSSGPSRIYHEGRYDAFRDMLTHVLELMEEVREK